MSVNPQPLYAALQSAIAPGVAVAIGKKPTVTAGKPWVVMWPDAGNVTDDSLRSRDGWATVVSFHCAGLTPESVLIAVRKVRDAVIGLHLQVIDGRTVQMPEHRPGPPMQRDDDADPPVFVQYDEWRIRTTA